MFTQCSKCETVFRLSADSLRAAGGQVRCGRCGEVFNALARLAEDSTGFTKGESPLFLESRADEILESSSSDLSEPPESLESMQAYDDPHRLEDLDLPPGVEVAHLQFIGSVDDELAAETSLEFTLPPGELDRIFVETRPSPLQQLAADGYRAERADVRPSESPRGSSLEPSAFDSSPLDSSALDSSALDKSSLKSPPDAPPAPNPERGVAPVVALPTAASPVPLRQRTEAPLQAPLTRISGLEVSEEVRQEMLSSLRADAPRSRSRARPASAEPALGHAARARLPFVIWLTAAILLILLFVVQVVRGNSDWLAVHMPFLGGPGSTAASLSVYQLRQWGVTGDPAAQGVLRVRASIMNTAPQLHPYPLLRVALVNRFGTRVGAREFEPSEYMGHAITRMLAPGERVDATLDILDPGKDAEGFEIDVCIRGADKKIFCAGDAAAPAK